MRTFAVHMQMSVAIDSEPFADYITLCQISSTGEDDDEIVITKPCIRAFIKELTRVADAMGA